MPLLHKEEFTKVKPPQDLRDEEEVFYCEMTDELFRNYDDFCERIIQCNSLVWSCSLTGKSDLTYQEALWSEQESQKILSEFPVQLKIPVLYLASLEHRSSQKDLIEDVYCYVKDRYFIGETVEVCLEENKWFDCHILQVLAPTEQEISKNLFFIFDKNCDPPALLYQYEVEKLECCDDEVSEVHHVQASKVKRKKGLFTREKNRLFLRQYTVQNEDGIWEVSQNAIQEFGLSRIKFESIFDGQLPTFHSLKKVQKHSQSPRKSGKKQDNSIKKEKRQENIQKYLMSPSQDDKASKKMSHALSEGEVSPTKKSPKKFIDVHHKSPQHQMAKKLKDKYKKSGLNNKYLDKHRMKKHKYSQSRLPDDKRPKLKETVLEAKERRREERLKIKEKRKEEKLRLAQFLKEWNRRREDLELEDLKLLPEPIYVDCRIPHEHFGDFIMILEFLHTFGQVISAKNFFPSGLTFELLERALTEQEVAGPLSDVIQLLLTTLFKMQEEEDDEILETDCNTAELDIDQHGDVTTEEAVRLATNAASWSQLYLGVPLRELALDAVTVTEVLRLHLLSSGGRSGDTSANWRYQQRGGYTIIDDPGLRMRIHQPHILRALGVMNVCELPIGDKLTILTCLIDQIMTYTPLRDVIDERGEKMRQAKANLRSHQIADVKRQREATAKRIKEKKEARLKMKGLLPSSTASEIETEKEKELLKTKAEKETARRKIEAEKKARNLHLATIGHQVLPLGSDRAHRRYWIFASLPGLFVEQDKGTAGCCLPNPTPYNAGLARADDTLSYVRKLFEEEWMCGSDKENDMSDVALSRPFNSSNKKLFGEKNMSNGLLPNSRTSGHSTWPDRKVNSHDLKTISQLLICTADENCPVHSSEPIVSWAFYNNEEDVNNLIKSLNRRGVRESDLRQTLIQEKPNIIESINRCPSHKLNASQVDNSDVPEQRKSARNTAKYEDANLNFPPGTPLADILETYIRDNILELEEKIHLGCLGGLKVSNRTAWRDCLMTSNYDGLSDKLVLGEKGDAEDKDMLNNQVEKLKAEDRNSRPSTPDSEISYKDPGRMLGTGGFGCQEALVDNPVLKKLALAILQVARGLEPRYLQKPLGLDEETPENSTAPIERWEVSLMASTSFSQLCIHLLALDNSIQWSKSVLNAVCRVCRRRRDAENMLLCDGCNKGHHLYCLKPKLTAIPKGDWFCPTCRPQEKVRVKKSRRVFSLDSEDDEPSKKESNGESATNEACDICGEDDGAEVVTCSTCELVFHLQCHNPPLKNPPRGKVYCHKCKPYRDSKAGKDGAMAVHQQMPMRQRRCCASAAVAKISRFARRLRSDSWDDEDSTQSEDVAPSRRSGRHSVKVNQDLPLNYPVLDKIIKNMIAHKEAWPFRLPVSKTEVPDYHTIIKIPMDLGLIKQKLENMVYKSDAEFIKDAMLVFENCQMYNQVDAPEYKAGVSLYQYFEKLCEEHGLQIKDDEIQPRSKRQRLSL